MAAAPQRAVETMAVQLAAVIDPFGPLIQTIQTSNANFQQLAKYWVENPFPIASTMLANGGTYLQELMNGNASAIPGQIWNNVKTFFSAPFSPGDTFTPVAPPPYDDLTIAIGENISNTAVVKVGPFEAEKKTVYVLTLQNFLVEEDYATLAGLAPILNFTNSHISSLLLGAIGPVIAPFLQLGKSFEAIGAALKTADLVTALNELINIPVKMTNAFLNGGQFLDLTGIVNAIRPLPPSFKKLGVELGGLLNLVPQNGSILPGGVAPTEFNGGVGFDGLGITASLGGLEATVPGLPIGLTGSALGLNRYTAQQMLVTPLPPKAGATVPAAAAAAAPAAPAALAEPAAPAVSAVEAPAAPAAPAVEAPATPAVPEAPAAPAVSALAELDIPAVVEAPAAPSAPAAEAPASSHRGGGSSGGDSGSNSGGRGHRGAA